MRDRLAIQVPQAELANLCRRYHVCELSVFGSATREDFGSDSDIDLLVRFTPKARVTFATLARMQRELETLLGRNIDLVPKDGLKPVIRDHVLGSAQVIYAA